MNTHHKLWKVVTTHQMGSQAPTFFMETKYGHMKSKTTRENKEVEELMALRQAEKQTRLADFPEKWAIRVEHQFERTWDSKRGKWMGWKK